MSSEKIPVFATPADFFVDPAKLKQTQDALQAAGCKYVMSTYVDVHGVPKAKMNPVALLEEVAGGSELFTVGAMEGMGLVGPEKDECAAVPDLDTLTVCPWDKRVGYFFGDLFYHGAPYENDSRAILKRQLDRAAALGFTFNVGTEPEFYVVRPDAPSRETEMLARDRYQGVCPAYDVHQTLGSLPFLEKMSDYINELEWGLYSFDQEGGHSQFEFDMKYADALTSADRFIFLRLMAKHVAESLGLVATFMPKPYADDFRSGNHFNMSLANAETGENLFAPEPDGNPLMAQHGLNCSKLAYHFSAGLLKHAGAITAVTSPTYNSYQGFIAQGAMADVSWAPILVAYGDNNRSAMLRIPPNRFCVENRAPDMSVNPYLALAITLAAGLEGIEQELDPGTPLNASTYDLTPAQLKAAGTPFLPRTLLHAIEAFEADPIAETAFGVEMRDIYVAQKQREWDEAFFPINPEHKAHRLSFI
jgi:glutamine synthetase